MCFSPRLGVLAGVLAGMAAAQNLERDQALALAFPGCEFQRQTITLTTTQRDEAERAAGTALRSALVIRYRATRGGDAVGTAYFDAHKVRTLPEILMVAVNASGEVERVEIVTFQEPQEYKPSATWLRQFDGKALSPALQLKRDIRPIAGATLSGRAATDAARRLLAVHAVLSSTGRE